MTYFILLHRTTMLIMPQEDRGRGSTWWDPIKEKKQRTPRLFARKIDAINSRRWWAEGPYEAKMDSDGESFTQKSKTAFITLPRDESHLDIVEVELKPVGQLEMRL